MIKVENLTKLFGTKRAVDGVSFSVERGEVLALRVIMPTLLRRYLG